jgi:hypothetical protein
MEDMELKAAWKAYNNKLDKLLQLNLHTFKQLQTQKANSKLKQLFLPKVTGIVLGMVWVLFLGSLAFFVLKNAYLFFGVSVAAITAITIIAVAAYIRDIVLIYHINNEESILGTQQKLAQLQLSTINTIRISVLQLPFYTTFFLSGHMLVSGGLFYLALVIIISGSAFFAAIWLFMNINYKNIDKKWLRLLLKGSGWDATVKAMEFLNQIDSFKQDALTV